ncbi:ABC transporter substrate-binding protein [Paratractidigestivibacter sp.]|uniref:ABC transporter substrate-binding protein n=1 Tax=Paratractidigestivibacter sp. TaxID=2847316 RepID=UPI002ABD3D35|nr:ABC transporter substrate-binding protein [Paratractidigestivibacter sp.]
MKANMDRRQFLSLSGIALAGLGLAGCGSSSSSSSSDSGSGDATKGSVYFLNFKPEVDEEWQSLAKKYTEKTGVEVKVVTAASDTYEQKLQSEISKSSAPTLFQVNGPTGLANWKDYCMDLTGTKILGELSNDALKLEADGKVCAIDYVEEDYGIIYNKELLTKAGYSGDDIKDFASLKKVADDIQARKAELGVEGAFTSAGMDSSSNWRFTTHLANLPIHYEFKDENEEDTDAIKGTYLPEYKQIFDLYLTDSTCDASQVASKTGDDAVNEFLNGKAVFYQNGTWAYKDIAALGDDKIGMIPIYIGATGEDKQGMCSGGENYWCVNSQASADDQAATLEFLYWVVTDDEATTAIAENMGLTMPFKSAKEISNPLAKIAKEYVEKGYEAVSWDFVHIPSEEWKKNLTSALVAYAAGGSWDDVKTAFVEGWATEKAASK